MAPLAICEKLNYVAVEEERAAKDAAEAELTKMRKELAEAHKVAADARKASDDAKRSAAHAAELAANEQRRLQP